MRTLPNSRAGRIDFFRTHLEQWLEEAEAIGLDSEQLTALAAQIAEAEAARAAAAAAHLTARSATLAFHEAEARLTATGRAAIATIKARAARDRDVTVYTQARLPVPANASPTPAPLPPRWRDSWVDANGRVHLSWSAEASGPRSGVFFLILRRGPGEREWRTLDAVQQTSFIDEHPPALTPGHPTSYALLARRGGQRSPMSATTSISAAPPSPNNRHATRAVAPPSSRTQLATRTVAPPARSAA